jgi:hypothetical protein
MLYVYIKKLKVIASRWYQAKKTLIEMTPFLRRVSITKQLIYYEEQGNGLDIYFTSNCKVSFLIISHVAFIFIILLRLKFYYPSIMNPEFIFIALFFISYKSGLVFLLGLVLHDGGKISLTVLLRFLSPIFLPFLHILVVVSWNLSLHIGYHQCFCALPQFLTNANSMLKYNMTALNN